MNNRNLALKISKHPLIELLKKDKTIPNSVVARLIVEELTAEQKKEIEDFVSKEAETAKAELESLFASDKPTDEETKSKLTQDSIVGVFEKVKEKIESDYDEEDRKQALQIAQEIINNKYAIKKDPSNLKELLVQGISDSISGAINEKVTGPIFDKAEKLIMGASVATGTASGGVGFIVGMGLRWLAVQGGEAGVNKAIQLGTTKIVDEILSSFKTIDDISEYVQIIFGDKLQKEIFAAKSSKDKITLIKANGLQIFKNIATAGVAGKFGDPVKNSFIKTLGYKPKIAGFELPIGTYFTEFVLGPDAAKLIDGSYDKIKQQEAKGEKIKKVADNVKKNASNLQAILEEMKDTYEILKQGNFNDDDLSEIPDLIQEGPSRLFTQASEAYQEEKIQTAIQHLVNGLNGSKKFLKNKYRENNKDQYKQQIFTFIQLYELGLAIQEELKKGMKKAEEDLAALNTASTEPSGEASTEPSGEASTEPSSEPSGETTTSKPEATSATDPKPKPTSEETIQTSEDPKDYQDFVKASNNLINDFYRQKYKIQQARIVDAVIQSMKEIVDDEDKKRSFQRTPDTAEETEALQEQEEKVEATEDQMRNIRIDIKSFLARVNKTKEYLNQFEKVAKTGSVLGDAYKKRFIDNLKEIQLAVYRIAIILNKILGPKQELDEAKESETLKKWKEVQGKYDRAAKAVNSLKELVATETPPTEIDKDLISDAYDSLADLSQHFPSVSPFGKPQKGVEMDKVFEKYQLEFGAAIQAVKNSLQTSLNVMKLGEAGRESLQNARDGLREFADEINRIFGVPSRFADAKVKPEDAKGEAVEGEAGVKDQESDETETDTEQEKTKEEITAENAIHDFLQELINKNLIILPKKEITEDLGTVALGLVGAGIIGKMWQYYETRYGGDEAVARIFADLLSRFLNKNEYLNTSNNFKAIRSRIIQTMKNFDSEKKQAIIKAYRKKFNEEPELTGKKVQQIVTNYLEKKQSISSAEDKEETENTDLTPKEDKAIKDATKEAVKKTKEENPNASEEEIVDVATKETMSSPEVEEITADMTDEEIVDVKAVAKNATETEVEDPKNKEETDNSEGVEILQQFFEHVKTEILKKEEQLKESYMDLYRVFTDDRRNTGTWEGGTTLFQNIGEYIEDNYQQELIEIIISKQPESSFWDKLVDRISTVSGSAISKIKSRTGKALAEMFLKWKGEKTQEKMKVFEAWKTTSGEITEKIIVTLVDKTLGTKFEKKDAVKALEKEDTKKALEATKTILTKFIKALKDNSSEKKEQVSESLIVGGMAALFTAGILGAAKQLVGQSRQSFFDFQVKKLFLNTLAKYLKNNYKIKKASDIVFHTWNGETLSKEEKEALIKNYTKPLFRSPKLTGEIIQQTVNDIFDNKETENKESIEEKIANKLKPLIHEMLTKGK